MSAYQNEFDQAKDNPEKFWEDKAKAIEWYKFPKTILQKDETGIDRWYQDGKLNSCYLALDQHVLNGRADQTALIYDSPVTDTKEHYTYKELTNQVARTAGMLAEMGVVKGDRVIIYMPMIPEAVMAMLACARLGAVHSVVFGGFAANELTIRIEDAEPKVIMAASCGIEVKKIIPYLPIINKAIIESRWKPEKVIIHQRKQCPAELTHTRDVDWSEQLANAKPHDCVPVNGCDPLYILYTSGTTGKPKGVVRENGGHAVAMKYSMSVIYDAKPGDVYWAASDIGWVVGHSYIVYAPLMHGCTTILYEGKPVKTPDPAAFWRVCQEHSVNILFSAPTAFRAIKKEDPDGELIKQYPMPALRTIFMAGERLDPPTLRWVEEKAKRPVVDHWWQTETGWAISGNPIGLQQFPLKAGSSTKPTPGFEVLILDEVGAPLKAKEQGFICIKLPLPPGCLATVWGNHDRFQSGYLTQFPGYYVSGDGGYMDEDGYLFVMGRIDDVINVAGHRLSTGEMEEILCDHNAVAECAVIGASDELKGQIPYGFVVLKDGYISVDANIEKELLQKVRDDIGAVASFRNVVIVNRLPKTRSGKVLRRTIKQVADGETYVTPSTIDDPTSLTEIENVFNPQ